MKINTRALTGFMELLPNEQAEFDRIKNIIERTYRKYNFRPIDTPTIERTEILLAKAGGETEKQIYRFKKGDNDLSLRFDLTVPTARYVAEHFHDLVFPFKQSQIGKVYRGERAQKGRFREFYQCDIDVIGHNELSLAYDSEIIKVGYEIFKQLDLGNFTTRISNRRLLKGLLSSLGLSEQSAVISGLIDKAEKIERSEFIDLLKATGLSTNQFEKIIEFTQIRGDLEEFDSKIKKLNIENDEFMTGVKEIHEVWQNLMSFGVDRKNVVIDLLIIRGLDYYTGTVFETILDDFKAVGSVFSGGRYENLTGCYSKEKLPGVGASIGLTRLFSQIRELKSTEPATDWREEVLIIPFSKNENSAAINLAEKLRSDGKLVDILFIESSIKKKFKLADRRRSKFVILLGENEVLTQNILVKDMSSGQQIPLSEF